MNEYTPTFNDIHIAYANYRVEEGRCSWDEAIEECDRFFIAHDQGIRDAVKPPEMTAREYLEAAFEAADPVPEGRDVPVGVTIIARRENGKIWVLATGLTSGAYDDIDVRTLEPLPPAVRPPTDPDSAAGMSEKADKLARYIVSRLAEATPADLVEAAFDDAYPLPEGRKLPADTPYLWKDEPVEGHTRIVFWPNGDPFENAYSDDVRTIDPLPPLIPDDCNRVFASVEWNPARLIWIRGIGDPDRWRAADGNAGGWNALTRDLIDPKPVPEEER